MPSSSSLLGFVSSMGGGDGLRVEESLGEGFVRLRVSEAERRQAQHDIRCIEDAVIELLRNARDAGARRIFVATSREGDTRTVVVLDDGVGIPDDMRERVFDARVTSKLDTAHIDRWGVHGRGMALFSIRENCEVAEVVDSSVGGGSSIRVVSDVRELTERADQSKWPSVGKSDGDSLTGPHNIPRTCCEFALEERDRCRVYVGSPAEVAATVRARVRVGDVSGDSVRHVLGGLVEAGDAPSFRAAAESVGLSMSERTAYRILSGEIRPLRHALLVLDAASGKGSGQRAAAAGPRPSISKEDANSFAKSLSSDFAALGEKYYLELVGEPRIRVSEGRITVSFDIAEQD